MPVPLDLFLICNDGNTKIIFDCECASSVIECPFIHLDKESRWVKFGRIGIFSVSDFGEERQVAMYEQFKETRR